MFRFGTRTSHPKTTVEWSGFFSARSPQTVCCWAALCSYNLFLLVYAEKKEGVNVLFWPVYFSLRLGQWPTCRVLGARFVGLFPGAAPPLLPPSGSRRREKFPPGPEAADPLPRGRPGARGRRGFWGFWGGAIEAKAAEKARGVVVLFVFVFFLFPVVIVVVISMCYDELLTIRL